MHCCELKRENFKIKWLDACFGENADVVSTWSYVFFLFYNSRKCRVEDAQLHRVRVHVSALCKVNIRMCGAREVTLSCTVKRTLNGKSYVCKQFLCFFKSHNHRTLTLNANAACQEDVSEFNADVLLIFFRITLFPVTLILLPSCNACELMSGYSRERTA